jgi:TFIIF-interacting CTD phosphatase-like protein
MTKTLVYLVCKWAIEMSKSHILANKEKSAKNSGEIQLNQPECTSSDSKLSLLIVNIIYFNERDTVKTLYVIQYQQINGIRLDKLI